MRLRKPKPSSDLPRWRIIRIAKKGQQLAVVKARDAATAVAEYAQRHGEDPRRLMALPYEGPA